MDKKSGTNAVAVFHPFVDPDVTAKIKSTNAALYFLARQRYKASLTLTNEQRAPGYVQSPKLFQPVRFVLRMMRSWDKECARNRDE